MISLKLVFPSVECVATTTIFVGFIHITESLGATGSGTAGRANVGLCPASTCRFPGVLLVCVMHWLLWIHDTVVDAANDHDNDLFDWHVSSLIHRPTIMSLDVQYLDKCVSKENTAYDFPSVNILSHVIRFTNFGPTLYGTLCWAQAVAFPPCLGLYISLSGCWRCHYNKQNNSCFLQYAAHNFMRPFSTKKRSLNISAARLA